MRLYDPASIKYWKDIILNAAQIQNGLNPGPQQEQTLNSIKIVNNFGLVDGPNLELRIDLYKRILKLQHSGIQVRTYFSKLIQIGIADKNKQNIATQSSELNATLIAAESTINQPISGSHSSSEIIDLLQQSWQAAVDRGTAALQTLKDDEQEQQNITLPEAHDWDSQARYASNCQVLQKKVNDDLQAWHKACQNRDIAYSKLMQTKATLSK